MMGQIIFFTFIVIWIILDSYIMIFHNKGNQYHKIETKSKYVIILGISFGMGLGQLLFPESRIAFTMSFNFLRYFGIFVIFLGLVIRMIAIIQLGKSFTDHIMVHKEKALYKQGLYKYIRHPSYLGEIMIFLGVAFVYAYLWSSLLAFFIPTLAFLYRISVEEKALMLHFKESYVEYQKETKKIIPFLF
jgi:protein-S-isoprenylcysteine O-methyltransferase Ste14